MSREITLKGKHTMVLGLKGTGKSNFTQYLLRAHSDKYGAHLMYDVCQEHDRLHRYTPTHRRGEEAREELERVLAALVVDAPRPKRPELVAVEEVSRFCGTGSPPPEALYELIDLNRHYQIGLLALARRPAQVHTDLIELADNLLIFRLTGHNDKKKLNRMVDGLGDVVYDLGDYQYVHVAADRSYQVMEPVREMNTTGKL